MEEKETDEELIKRHRKEKKDLQGEVYVVYNKQVNKTELDAYFIVCIGLQCNCSIHLTSLWERYIDKYKMLLPIMRLSLKCIVKNT